MLLHAISNVDTTPVDVKTTKPIEKVTIESAPEEPEWETWVLTAYDDSPEENGGWTITASGEDFRDDYTLACPRELPFGTEIEIEDIGVRVCQDRGGSIKGKRLDVFIRNAVEMQRFGRQERRVRILNEKGTIE
ncbi:3D domain-containing protein [Paenibacillus alvei]|uniref:3D domain-containing protein n=1 Tax=Paenibacillus alvei TaxID=44250 RepID=A0ABT4GUM5_PAEAL|nr:3D domain-containing protein [Paenibacillus alvei]MCY9760396.1 3D domain-containing protein [Paenibacillus alvei]MCY9767688.1 3D domain-containing protein [Paenibacillus alvei]